MRLIQTDGLHKTNGAHTRPCCSITYAAYDISTQTKTHRTTMCGKTKSTTILDSNTRRYKFIQFSKRILVFFLFIYFLAKQNRRLQIRSTFDKRQTQTIVQRRYLNRKHTNIIHYGWLAAHNEKEEWSKKAFYIGPRVNGRRQKRKKNRVVIWDNLCTYATLTE